MAVVAVWVHLVQILRRLCQKAEVRPEGPHSGTNQVLLSSNGKGSSRHRLEEEKLDNLAVSTVTAFMAYHSSKIFHSGSFGF